MARQEGKTNLRRHRVRFERGRPRGGARAVVKRLVPPSSKLVHHVSFVRPTPTIVGSPIVTPTIGVVAHELNDGDGNRSQVGSRSRDRHAHRCRAVRTHVSRERSEVLGLGVAVLDRTEASSPSLAVAGSRYATCHPTPRSFVNDSFGMRGQRRLVMAGARTTMRAGKGRGRGVRSHVPAAELKCRRARNCRASKRRVLRA